MMSLCSARKNDTAFCILCRRSFNKNEDGDVLSQSYNLPMEIRQANICSNLCGSHVQYNLGVLHGILLCDILQRVVFGEGSVAGKTGCMASTSSRCQVKVTSGTVEDSRDSNRRVKTENTGVEDFACCVSFLDDGLYDDSTDVNEDLTDPQLSADMETKDADNTSEYQSDNKSEYQSDKKSEYKSDKKSEYKSVRKRVDRRKERSCVRLKNAQVEEQTESSSHAVKFITTRGKHKRSDLHKNSEAISDTQSSCGEIVRKRPEGKLKFRPKLIIRMKSCKSEKSSAHAFRAKRQKMSQNDTDDKDSTDDVQMSSKEERAFQCDFCRKSFNAKRFLQRHLNRFHPKEIAVRCDVCGDPCKNQKCLNSHMRKEHNVQVLDKEELYHCDQCPKCFSSARGLSLHKEFVHSQENPVNCQQCHLTLKNDVYLKRHMKRSHSDSVICDICGAQFKSRLGLNVHVSAHKGVKSYFCEVCGVGFVRKTSLRRHVQQHNDVDYNCDTCSSSYKTLGSLSLHMLQSHQRGSYFHNRLRSVEKLGYVVDREAVDRHLNQRCVTCGGSLVAGACPEHPADCALIFQCQRCDLTAEHVDDLLAHLRDHSKGATAQSTLCVSFRCKVCGKVFPRKLYLKQHIKKQHPGASMASLSLSPSSLTYCCQVCGKHFTHRQYLYVHMKQHLQPRSFACHLCDRKFTYKCNLKNHLTTHSQDKPFQCEVCQKLFRRKEVLNSHRLVHTPSLSPFKCQVCGKGLSRKQYLKKHLQIMHPDTQGGGGTSPLPLPQSAQQ